MKIIVGSGSGVVSSDDRPVMIKFTKSELDYIKKMPDSDDVFVSFPSHWQDNHSMKWAQENRYHINGKKVPPQLYLEGADKVAEEVPAVPPQPLPAEPKTAEVKSDQEIIDILSVPDTAPRPAVESTVEKKEEVEIPATISAEEGKDDKKKVVSDADLLGMLGVQP